MLDNLGIWLESDDHDDEYCNDGNDGGSRKEEDGKEEDVSKYPKCSKLVVINSKPQVLTTTTTQKNEQRGSIQVSTSFHDDDDNNKTNIDNEDSRTITPKLSNSSSSKSSTRFKFDDEYNAQLLQSPIFDDGHNNNNLHHHQQDVFSGISSLSNVSHRDSDRHYITRFNDRHNNNIGRKSSRDSDDENEMYSSDDDPFSNVCNEEEEEEHDDGSSREDEDGRTVPMLGPTMLPSSMQHCQTTDNDNRSRAIGEEKKQPASEVLSSSSPSMMQVKNDNKSCSSEGRFHDNDDDNMLQLQLIQTESEERNIMSHYAMKRDIATKQIAKDIIHGYDLIQDCTCPVCHMPMTTRNTTSTTTTTMNNDRNNAGGRRSEMEGGSIGDNNAPRQPKKVVNESEEEIECTTCMAVKRNAKRIARQKRKKIVSRLNNNVKNVQQRGCITTAAAAADDDDDNDTKHNIAGNDTRVNEEDVTRRSSSCVNENNIEFVTIDKDTLSTLEEGLQQISRMEADGSRPVDNMNGDRLYEQRSEEEKPSAANYYYGGGNYWVRHSSSQLSSSDTIDRRDLTTTQFATTSTMATERHFQQMEEEGQGTNAVSSSSSTTSYSHHRQIIRGGEDYSHSTNEIEYSLSWYQENTNQQQREECHEKSSDALVNAPLAMLDEISDHNCLMSNHSYHGSISDVSAYPRDGQDSAYHYEERSAISSKYQVMQSMVSETQQLDKQLGGDEVTSGEVRQEQQQSSAVIPAVATDVYSSQCSQIIYQESIISEVSEYCNNTNQQQSCCSSDEGSSTRCPRTIPSDEMIYKYSRESSPNNNDHVMTEEELVEEGHPIDDGCTHQESISEVSEYDNNKGAVPPSMKNNKECQTNVRISVQNNTEEGCCQPPVGEGTISSVVDRDDILPQGSSSEESMVSVVSSTRCPRDLPPSEMIYPIMYPIQSIACEQRDRASAGKLVPEIGTRVNDDQLKLEQGIVEPQQAAGDCQSLNERQESRGFDLFNPVLEVPTTMLLDEWDTKLAQNQLPPLHEATDHRDGPADQVTLIGRKVDDSLSMRIARLANSLKDAASQFPNDRLLSETNEADTGCANHSSSQNLIQPPKDQIGQYNENLVCQREERDEWVQGNMRLYHQPPFNMSVISESKNPGLQKRNYHFPSSPIVANEQNTVCAPHRPLLDFWNNDKECMVDVALQPVSGSSNCVGISISPINVSRDEKRFDDTFQDVETPSFCKRNRNNLTQRTCIHSSPPVEENRADPPGRRLDSNSEERIDPPDNITLIDSPKPRTHETCLPRTTYRGLFRNTGRDDPPQENAPKSIERRVPNRSKSKLSSVLTSPVPDEVYDKVSPLSWKAKTVALQTKQSWGESSMDELFQQIDEIEGDFNTIVSQMPSGSYSVGQSTQSLKNSTKQFNELEQSLVGITLNNVGSFGSYASSEDSMVNGVVERMRVIKNYIEQVDSLDDDVSVDSQDVEMTELMQRLEIAAESLRELNEWE